MLAMLAGQVLGSAVFSVWKISGTITNLTQSKPKRPSSDLSVALDVFLSYLKCEMNGISQGKVVYIV